MRTRAAVAFGVLFLPVLEAAFSSTPGFRVPDLDREASAIISVRCLACHGALKTSGLDLRSRSSLLKGGTRGPSIVPGQSSRSLLVRAVAGAGTLHMPPSGSLPKHEVDVLRAWVDAGARWPADRAVSAGLPWPFTPVVRPPTPMHPGQPPRNPIDLFVLDGLRAKGMALSPPADRRTLIRRAYFDLVGLPPSPEEVEGFVQDPSPRAWENVIDRLLSSPRYGERWARHWLDLARYAESEGFKADEMRPNAWRYRDYVIQSLNADKPYDRFLREQIAGDQLYPDDPDALVATGFLRHWADESNARNLLQRRQEILNDITDTVGASVLGMTFACARCHDHKYDPIPQKDYYRLQAFFAGIRPRDDIPLLTGEKRAEYDRRLREWEAKTAGIREEIAELEGPAYKKAFNEDFNKFPAEVQAAITMPAGKRNAMQWFMFHKAQPYFRPSRQDIENSLKGDQKQHWLDLQSELDSFRDLHPGPLPVAIGVTDLAQEPPPTFVLAAGNFAAPQTQVQPGFPALAGGGDAQDFISGITLASGQGAAPDSGGSSFRRSALAAWVTSRRNPLTARVMVNRLWHYHFGRGLVATPSDFGKQGEKASYPGLLDWLAAELMDPNAEAGIRRPAPWSLKHLHRLIMTSSVYRQSSGYSPHSAKADPANRMFWRFHRKRLEGEVIRDSILAVSGQLNDKMGGQSVMAELPDGLTTRGYWKETDSVAERNRRSIYIFVKRNLRYPLFEAFDMPDTHEPCARRVITTTATQSLMLMNNDVVLRGARFFAARVLREAGADSRAGIARAYSIAYGRGPSAPEISAAERFLRKQASLLKGLAPDEEDPLVLPPYLPSGLDPYRAAALVDFCHTLLNSNEFLYVE